MALNKAETKKQVEYYLSDKNLATDKFFNEKITAAGKDGWIDMSCILACNKIKQLKVTAEQIAEAVKDSTDVEVDASGKRIRRLGDKPLPALAKKRDQKASDKAADGKEETKTEEEALPAVDERGNLILSNADFENPVIVHFKTAETKDEPPFKVNWKDIETAVRKGYPRLKITYSRADPFEGDLAISTFRLNQEELDKLNNATLRIQDRDFTFSKTLGEDLKSFWQKQGGHYQFCIQPKLRNIKKQQKIARMKKERGEGEDGAPGKRGKTSFEIAG
jgi:Protein of unknown function (DUF3223)/La domain